MAANDYWDAYYDSEQSFTDTSYAEKHTLDFTAPAQGDYWIMVSCALRVANTAESVFVRAQIETPLP